MTDVEPNENRRAPTADDVEFHDGYSPATRRGYASDWASFRRWCEAEGRGPLPADPETVAAYVEAKSASLKPATVSRHVAAVAVAHRDLDLPDPTKGRSARIAAKKMFRKRGRRQRQAVGITFELRNRMIDAAGNGLAGLRDKAMLAVAYDLGCRRSELVGVLAEELVRAEDGSATILLRKTKTDQDGAGHVRFVASETVRLVDAWLDGAGVEDGPLFRSVDRHGNVGTAQLHPCDVSRLWKKMAMAARLPPELVRGISGHSTRVGFAQDMAAAGIDLVAIMQAGGWKSPNMVARYVERLDARQGASARLAAAQGRF
jgi:integrase